MASGVQTKGGFWQGRMRALAAAAIVAIAGCGDVGEAPEPPPPTTGSATLSAAGGTVTGPDGVQLVVPADSLETPLTFRVARDASGAPELIGLNAVSPVYAVTPHGQAFGTGALFSIPMSATQLPAGATPVLLKAEPGGTWRVMANASTDPTRMAADIDGLSFFVIGTCAAVQTQGWTIGAVGCPSSHELRLTMFDGQNNPVQVLRGPNGVRLPLWHVTDTPQTRSFRVDWVRPSSSRVDQVSVAGSNGGFTPNPVDVTANFSQTFNVTIDPSQIGGANGVNGVIRRVTAVADYTTTAFQVGRGTVPAGFQFVTDIPILVRFNGALPNITQQPINVGVTEGQAASFTVGATGGTLSYQWARRPNLGAGFVDISGATAASYTVAAAQLADHATQFQVRVCSAPTRCVMSIPATLTVTQAPVVPAFSTHPADVAVVAGQTASFSATATGTPLPQLRWQMAAPGSSSFSDVTGLTACGTTNPPGSGTSVTANCTVGPLAVGNSGQRYRAAATNAASVTGVISNLATLTVAAAPAAPVITQQPAAQTTTVGGSATFSVAATGTASLTYTWATLGGGLLPSTSGGFRVGSCAGTITYSNGDATITLSGLNIFCSGFTVTVTVSNGVNPSATSTPALLTVTQVVAGMSLLAGELGGVGTIDGTGSEARLQQSYSDGLTIDASGNAYLSVAASNLIRKVTPAGVISTFIGAGAGLQGPMGLALDRAGNLYVAEAYANRILRISTAGAITVWAGSTEGYQDGAGAQAQFSNPWALAIDANDNLYVSEIGGPGNNRLRKITPSQQVSTLVDFGSSGIWAMAVDANAQIYVAGYGSLNGTIQRISPSGGVSLFAGAAGESGFLDGNATTARFGQIYALAFDAAGRLWLSDGSNRAIRRVSVTGDVVTVSGLPQAPQGPVDGSGASVRYESTGAIAFMPTGDLLIADFSTLRRLTPSAVASTVAGKTRSRSNSIDGTGSAARFRNPGDVVVDSAGNTYVGEGDRIRHISPAGVVTTLAMTPASQLALDSNGGLVAASSNAVWRVSLAGVATLLAGDPSDSDYVDGAAGFARFRYIGGLAIDAIGHVFVSEGVNSENTIRRITPAGVVSTWAGIRGVNGSAEGPRLSASFSGPSGLAFAPNGDLLVADTLNNTVRRISSAGQVSTLAGTAGTQGSADGNGTAAQFRNPDNLAVDAAGLVYVGDSSNGMIRRITPAGAVSTVVGAPGEMGVRLGSAPRLNHVWGLALRANGRLVITSESAVLEAVLP